MSFHCARRNPHAIVEHMGCGHRPGSQPVSSHAVLVRRQVRMLPAHLGAAPLAPVAPYSVLGYAWWRKLGQLGAIGAANTLLHRCLATGKADFARPLTYTGKGASARALGRRWKRGWPVLTRFA